MAHSSIVSAPGKVILNGEHAVVFGKHAIAVSVDLRTTVEVHDTYGQVSLKMENFDVETEWKIEAVQAFVFGCFKEKDVLKHSEQAMARVKEFLMESSYGKATDSICAFWFLYFSISDIFCDSRRIPMEVKVHSLIPVGAGMGSSAAFTTSLTGALLKAFGVDHSVATVSEIAFQVEHIFHGKPSGIDTSICTFGGAVLFKTGTIQDKISEVEMPPVVLVYTNVTRNTKKLVEMTTERRRAQPRVIELIMDAIDAISLSTWQCLKSKGEEAQIEVLAETNHHLLNAIGAGHTSIDSVVSIAKGYGLSAKLTGAGGGGTVVIYLKHGCRVEDVMKMKDELHSNGFECWQVPTGVTGLLIQ